jgi:hypothetical protein
MATGNGTFSSGTGTVALNGPVRISANSGTTALNVSGLATVSGLVVNNTFSFPAGSSTAVFDLSGIGSNGTIKLSGGAASAPVVQYGSLSGGEIKCSSISVSGGTFTQTGNFSFTTGTGDVTLKGNTTVDSDRLFAAGRFMDADRSNYSIASYFPTGVPRTTASGGGIELPSQLGKYGVDGFNNIIFRSRMRPAAIFMPEIGPIRFTDQYYRKPSTADDLYVFDEISFPITGITRSTSSPLNSADMYFTISGGGDNCLICPGMIVTISGNAGGIPNGESKYVQAVGGGKIILGYSNQPLFGGTYILGEGFYNPTNTDFDTGSSIVLSKTANTGLFIGGKWGSNGRDTSLTASGGLILGNYANGQPGKISTASYVPGLNITSVSGPIRLFGETGGARLTVPQVAGTAVSVSGGLNVTGNITFAPVNTTAALGTGSVLATVVTTAVGISGLPNRVNISYNDGNAVRTNTIITSAKTWAPPPSNLYAASVSGGAWCDIQRGKIIAFTPVGSGKTAQFMFTNALAGDVFTMAIGGAGYVTPITLSGGDNNIFNNWTSTAGSRIALGKYSTISGDPYNLFQGAIASTCDQIVNVIGQTTEESNTASGLSFGRWYFEGLPGSGGIGGLAYNASLNGAPFLTRDSSNNLFIGDSGNNRVIRIDSTSGIVTVVAGNGSAPAAGAGVSFTDGATATSVAIGRIQSLAIDIPNSLLYMYLEAMIVRVDILPTRATFGKIYRVVGTGISGNTGEDGSHSTSAQIHGAKGGFSGILVDRKNNLGRIYFSDNVAHRIRTVTDLNATNSSGLIYSVAGSTTGISGNINGISANARFNIPTQMDQDYTTGNYYVIDSGNKNVRVIPVGWAGVSTSNFGSGPSSISGRANASGLQINSIAFDNWNDTSTYMYVTATDFPTVLDTGIAVVWRVNVSDGNINGQIGSTLGCNGPGAIPVGYAKFANPRGIVVDATNRSNFYVCDNNNHTVRKFFNG